MSRKGTLSEHRARFLGFITPGRSAHRSRTLVKLIDKSGIIELSEEVQIPHGERADLFCHGCFHATETVRVRDRLNVGVRFYRELCDAVVGNTPRLWLSPLQSFENFFSIFFSSAPKVNPQYLGQNEPLAETVIFIQRRDSRRQSGS